MDPAVVSQFLNLGPTAVLAIIIFLMYRMSAKDNEKKWDGLLAQYRSDSALMVSALKEVAASNLVLATNLANQTTVLQQMRDDNERAGG